MKETPKIYRKIFGKELVRNVPISFTTIKIIRLRISLLLIFLLKILIKRMGSNNTIVEFPNKSLINILILNSLNEVPLGSVYE